MALLVLWFVVYFLVDVFRGLGASRETPIAAGASIAVLPGDDVPLHVEWELLPAIDQAADRD